MVKGLLSGVRSLLRWRAELAERVAQLQEKLGEEGEKPVTAR
jgi:hypothetical protein